MIGRFGFRRFGAIASEVLIVAGCEDNWKHSYLGKRDRLFTDTTCSVLHRVLFNRFLTSPKGMIAN